MKATVGKIAAVEENSRPYGKGIQARAEALRFFEEHSRTFCTAYAAKQYRECVLTKTRHIGTVIALEEHITAAESLSKCICHNLTFA